MFQVSKNGRRYCKTFASKLVSDAENLRSALQACDDLLLDLGLPAITADPVM